MKKLIIFLPLLAFLFQSCDDEKDEYRYGRYEINWIAAADSSVTSLVDHFWNAQDNYFNYGSDESLKDFHYWPQAHAMDVVIDAYSRTNDDKYKAYFDKWYAGIKIKNGGTYKNDFFDDMEWIALTMIRIYDVTKDEKYLTTAKELWGYIKAGWNDQAGGGIAWVSNQLWSKNACSNGPASIIASRMYNITKDESDKEWALKIYNWEKEVLFNQSTGAVYDNINGETGKINELTLSYNQGTFLGAAYELYKITKDPIYLNDARKTAYYGISNSGMIDGGNNILRDEGNGDGGLFKGIFMRYYVELLLEDDLDKDYRNKFITFFNNNANVAWYSLRKSDVLFNTSWAATLPFYEESTQLTTQTSGCTMIEMKVLYESLKKKK